MSPIRPTSNADTANVAPLTTKAGSGPAHDASAAPTAGPMNHASCPTVASAALAAARSLSGTSSGVAATAAGRYGVVSAAATTTSTTTTSGWTPIVMTSATTTMTAARARSSSTIRRRRSNRSAIAPPIGPRSMDVAIRAVAAAATQPTEPVSSMRYTTRATR